MNPVLLKPQSDVGAQIVVQGRPRRRQGARDYPAMKRDTDACGARKFRPAEGAKPISCWSRVPAAPPKSICARTTSPIWALRARPNVPVVLIGDIDRGGVIAQLVGTKGGDRRPRTRR